MNISIAPFEFQNAGIGEVRRTPRECIELVRDAGFRHLDAALPQGENPEEFAAFLRQQGMQVIQSHIPFYRPREVDYEEAAKANLQCIKDAHAIGSQIAVVHGEEFDYKAARYTRERAMEFNYRFFEPLVDYAAQNGMRVAFESVFQETDSRLQPRLCSYVEDLCELVERYHTDTVGICWDVGHAKLQYRTGYLEALQTAGKRVICTHMHDNFYDRDLHLFPFFGDMNWQGVMHTLRQIGYAGDFSLEVAYSRIPKALAPEYLSLLYKSVDYLIKS